MPTIHLVGIECRDTQEAVDEAYLKGIANFGGDLGVIWERSMDKGDASSIARSFDFGSWIELSLYERDRVGRDECFGTMKIAIFPPDSSYRPADPAGEQRYTFESHGAKYVLTYIIVGGAIHKATLKLLSLHCNDAQEGTDEVFINVNSVRKMEPTRMRTGNTHTIGVPGEGLDVPFDTRARIEVWEHDVAVSEFIAFRQVMADVVPAGEETGNLTARFSRDEGIVGDASYTLTYRVRHEPL